MTMLEELARIIAEAMGDNYSDAFKNKERWVAKRGMSGGRFRDVNEPFRCDYEEAARAVLESPIITLEIDRAKAEAIEALKPFADCCDQIADDEPDDEWAKFRLLISDYRRAKDAIQALKDKHDDA